MYYCCPVCNSTLTEDGERLRCWNCEMAEAAYDDQVAEESYAQFLQGKDATD